MKHLIAAKSLTAYVDGTVQAPAAESNSGKDLASHLQKASQASVLLLASVDQKIRPLLINCESPKAIWDKLKQLYSAATEDAKQAAWENFYKFKMSDGESLDPLTDRAIRKHL